LKAIYVVTGSRQWEGDVGIVKNTMVGFYPEHEKILYHGDCPDRGTGRSIDWLARDIALELGWEIKSFPANWKEFGRSAGPIRNREMVKSAKEEKDNGVIVEVYAWPTKSSIGTWDCVKKAKMLGLKVFVND